MLLNAWPPPQLEIELKYLLDPEGYRKLLDKLSDKILGKESFTTFYLDTKKGHLKQAGFNLRIRMSETAARMTLKFATVLGWDGESKPKMRWEMEDDFDVKLAHEVVEGKKALSVLANRGVQVLKANVSESKLEGVRNVGQLDIQRTKVQWMPDVILEVDRYLIAGEAIHEIEIEIQTKDPDTIHKSFTSKMDEWKINWEETEISKRSRLFASLKKR